MTDSKSSDSRQRSSSRIACYGTAFLADTPIDEKLLMRGITNEVPQFGSLRLDASFLIKCGRFLAGEAAPMHSNPSAFVRRVAGSDFRSPKAVVLYECSSELRELLASVTPRRAAELATEWYGMYGAPKSKPTKPSGRAQIRLAILTRLADMAKQAKADQMALMLRVVYRKRSKSS